jgi:starch synthase
VKILFATSEAVPFAKTGGLADVSGTLPVELSKLGHEAALILPAYASAFNAGQTIEPTGVELAIPIGSKIARGRLLRTTLPESNVPVYLVEQDYYYHRPQL